MGYNAEQRVLSAAYQILLDYRWIDAADEHSEVPKDALRVSNCLPKWYEVVSPMFVQWAIGADVLNFVEHQSDFRSVPNSPKCLKEEIGGVNVALPFWSGYVNTC